MKLASANRKRRLRILYEAGPSLLRAYPSFARFVGQHGQRRGSALYVPFRSNVGHLSTGNPSSTT